MKKVKVDKHGNVKVYKTTQYYVLHLKVGDSVIHRKFGKGVVVKLLHDDLLEIKFKDKTRYVGNSTRWLK